jgi:hypothetical protein
MNFIFGLIVGLTLGWNLLPQPEFIKALIDTYILRKP